MEGFASVFYISNKKSFHEVEAENPGGKNEATALHRLLFSSGNPRFVVAANARSRDLFDM